MTTKKDAILDLIGEILLQNNLRRKLRVNIKLQATAKEQVQRLVIDPNTFMISTRPILSSTGHKKKEKKL